MSRGTIVLIVLIVLGVGLVVGLSIRRNAEKTAECTPSGHHDHATFGVVVNGTEYRWLGPRFDFPNAGTLAGHIHQSSPQTIHMESATDCITLAKFFTGELQSTLTKDTLALDKVQHGGATFHDGQNGHLRFFLGTPPSTWKSGQPYLNASSVNWTEAPNLPSHQPHDGEYLLVVFGNDTDAQIQQYEREQPIQTASEASH